jgi:hypothetical protein
MREELRKLECRPGLIRTLLVAAKAWDKIRNTKTWEGWVIVGECIESARMTMMRQQRFNSTISAEYNAAWGQILRATELDEIPPRDRSMLKQCIENLEAITAWRATLDDRDRLRFNHPATVFKRWQESLPVEWPESDDIGPTPGATLPPFRRPNRARTGPNATQRLLDSQEATIADLRQTIDELRAKIAQLEATIAELQAQLVGVEARV